MFKRDIFDNMFVSGAMMSHDNLTWTARICVEQFNHHKERLLCYLPLSHIAANMTETFASIYGNHTVYFADDQVLKGTLVSTVTVYVLHSCDKKAFVVNTVLFINFPFQFLDNWAFSPT